MTPEPSPVPAPPPPEQGEETASGGSGAPNSGEASVVTATDAGNTVVTLHLPSPGKTACDSDGMSLSARLP